MKFYVGLHQPSDAHRFSRCMISINRLKTRKSYPALNEWMMDSGAFSTISGHGRYIEDPETYADRVWRWRNVGTLVAAVSEDYMCEPLVLLKTGLTVRDHQALTIARYDHIKHALDTLEVRYAPWKQRAPYLMPVLQGYEPAEYVQHVADYGDRLQEGAWVGVGSVCKRNSHPQSVLDVLGVIKTVRPDLRLHGFGLKITSLENPEIRGMLHSSDSMAWSFSARMSGRSGNDWREARSYSERVEGICA